jgi:xanthine dehydrogenase YagS FAD-binding subunit
VTATVAFALSGGIAKDARVALGHVAPTPWQVPAAARILNGANVNESSATQSGEVAAQGARPLSGNAYKVQMVKAAVKRAALAAAA